MVYKTATQKILIYLFIITFSITLISGPNYWKMWSILPLTFFILWLSSKYSLANLRIDVMFMDESSFKYEPIYENWK